MSRRKTQPLWFCLLFLAVGLGILGWGAYDLARAVQSMSWKSISGRVTSSQVTSERSRKGGTTYHADVEYQYIIGSQTYTGDQVWFGQFGSSNADVAREAVQSFPVGREATVYYDPDDPDSSVLQPGVFPSTWVIPGVGVLFAGAGTLMFLDWWKRRPK